MMEKLWNTIRGLFNMVAEMDRLRADVTVLQDRDWKRELNDQAMLARLEAISARLEHKDELHAAETRTLKAGLEAILLRFERRLLLGASCSFGFTTTSHDFARHQGVFIEGINGAQTMIAVDQNDFAASGVAHQKDR